MDGCVQKAQRCQWVLSFAFRLAKRCYNGAMGRLGHIARVVGRIAAATACALAISLVPACGGASSGGSGGGNAAADAASTATGVAFAQPAEVNIAQKGGPGIDASHADEGYISVSASNDQRLKFQVTCGDMTYNYDLPNDGTPTIYPVNMGNGSYLLRIMQNTSGSNYVQLDAQTVDVALSDEFGPFLYPNMYCDYEADSACVSKAREVTSKAGNVGEVVRDICTFVASNTKYDNAKAEKLSKATGYVPDPDSTLKSGTGICLDYASLSAAMLRSMGIPTKVMTGYVGKDELYHSWIMVYIDGTWHTAAFSVDPNTWSRCDVTFASTGATKYVGDASAYTDRYTY